MVILILDDFHVINSIKDPQDLQASTASHFATALVDHPPDAWTLPRIDFMKVQADGNIQVTGGIHVDMAKICMTPAMSQYNCIQLHDFADVIGDIVDRNQDIGRQQVILINC